MLDVTMVAVGKIRDKNIREIIERYDRMTKKFGRLRLIEVEPSSFSESEISRQSAKVDEGKKMLKVLGKYSDNSVFLCEEKGKNLDSEEFSKLISDNVVVLVVAGALGFSQSIKDKYSNTLSLSPLTFPHELARAILYEQIYRAATIIANKTYHY